MAGFFSIFDLSPLLILYISRYRFFFSCLDLKGFIPALGEA